ncbi:MAG: RluA family pseudouridine synthase [Hyphomicrobiaceae bacterium]
MSSETATSHDIDVGPTEDQMRLDRFLAGRLEELSRSRIQALIRGGEVTLAARPVSNPGAKVKEGETYVIQIPAAVPAEPEAEHIPLSILHEDEHLIVIDKPPGLVVHPAAGHATGTLVNALIAHCGESLSGIGGVRRPGIVHRLDKDTSGILVVAKTDRAHAGLSEQFASHGLDGRLERRYVALAWGAPDRAQGTIDAALTRSAANRTKISVTRGEGGRHAVTHYAVQRVWSGDDRKPQVSRLELTLETGRTHQIRVHLAHIGHPILGDAIYGAGFKASIRKLPDDAAAALEALGRQALHAGYLSFIHPVTRRRLKFTSPPPPDMQRLVAALDHGLHATKPAF